MDEKSVPYMVFESTTARMGRSMKRLAVALIVATLQATNPRLYNAVMRKIDNIE